MIENLIFSQLLCNEQYARKTIPHLKAEYFDTQEEKNFFLIYQRFWNKHHKIPSKQAILLEIDKLKSAAEAHKALVELANKTETFEETLDWLIEQTELFCKEKALFNALKASVLIMDGHNKNELPSAIPNIITQALAVCFDTSVGHDYINDAEHRFDYYNHTEARVRTGIKIVDKITKGGFPKKTFNVILAPPHGGKSLTLVNIGAGALNSGSNVLHLTLEMAAEEIGKRYDVNLMDIDFDTLATLQKNVFTSKFSQISKKSRGRLIIKEYPTGVASAAHFRQLLAELKTKQDFVPDMIIVDYMNICASEYYKTGSNHNSYTIVGSIGKELRALAIEFDAALVSATQTNRSGVGSTDIDQTAMSDSAGTSMIADFILACISTDELKQLNQILFKQIKNRYNGTADFEKFLLGVNYSKQQLYELEEDAQQIQKTPKLAPNKPLNKSELSFDIEHKIKDEIPKFDFTY